MTADKSKKINFYLLFHMNLMFSSIDEKSREEIIKKCYWPLLDLAKNDVKIAIEAPGLTLEIIKNIDRSFIEVMKDLIFEGKIQFIGSGYSQIIGPLVPTQLNNWNMSIGNKVYNDILSYQPHTALINEMAFSSSLINHYISNNYKTIIIEWNNSVISNPRLDENYKYFPQKIENEFGETINVIWSNSIAFQKFQRVVHGEMDLESYFQYLKENLIIDESFFSLYSNDAEVFDFRPGRFKSEPKLGNVKEWDKINQILSILKSYTWCELIFPKDIESKNKYSGHILNVTSSSYPVLVKKQEKYNLNRWASTGRNDIQINSKCYKIYQEYIKSNIRSESLWKELCFLWSSDFRTHITLERWNNYKRRLDDLYNKNLSPDENNIHTASSKKININAKVYNNVDTQVLEASNDNILLFLDKIKGCSIKNLIFKNVSSKSLLTSLTHGYFDDIRYSADFFSGHSIIEKYKKNKITDLTLSRPEQKIENDTIIIKNKIENNEVVFINKILICSDKIRLIKETTFNTKDLIYWRPFNFTFNPSVWNKNLYFKSHNGYSSNETFFIKNQYINYNETYSSLVTSKYGLGNTEGEIIFGDDTKELLFKVNMTKSALIPKIYHTRVREKVFLRLSYSGIEFDDTSIKRSDEDVSIKAEIEISAKAKNKV